MVAHRLPNLTTRWPTDRVPSPSSTDAGADWIRDRSQRSRTSAVLREFEGRQQSWDQRSSGARRGDCEMVFGVNGSFTESGNRRDQTFVQWHEHGALYESRGLDPYAGRAASE
jgi:hypothetical protein